MAIQVPHCTTELGDGIVQRAVAVGVRTVQEGFGSRAPRSVPMRAHFSEIPTTNATRRDHDGRRIDTDLTLAIHAPPVDAGRATAAHLNT